MGIQLWILHLDGKRQTLTGQRCAPIFESGQVYYPKDEKFAEEVIEECAAFPWKHDDYVDSTTQAMLRYRKDILFQLIQRRRGNKYKKEKIYTIRRKHEEKLSEDSKKFILCRYMGPG